MIFEPFSGGVPLTKDKFVEAMHQMFRNESVYRLIVVCFTFWFNAIDSDGNGQIDIDEFISVFNLFGFNAEQAIITFQAMDTDHDGVLSLEEYVRAGNDYITGEDESSPFKYFFGPLV